MGRSPRSRSGLPGGAAVALLATGLLAPGCALLIPPGWRGHAPLPLAGPIDDARSAESDADAGDPATLSDEQLRVRIGADQQRLIEIASRPGAGPLADAAAEAELREIALRLPSDLGELERRGGGSDARIRRPVVR